MMYSFLVSSDYIVCDIFARKRRDVKFIVKGHRVTPVLALDN